MWADVLQTVQHNIIKIMNNIQLSDNETRIILLIRNLKPYDSIEISLQRQNPSILQVITRNITKELFPFTNEENIV